MVDTSDEWIVVAHRHPRAPHLAEERPRHVRPGCTGRRARAGMRRARRRPTSTCWSSAPRRLTICSRRRHASPRPSSGSPVRRMTSTRRARGSSTRCRRAPRPSSPGAHDTVLVIGADALTRHIDFTDRATCVLFGDGAGAVVLRASEEPGVMAIVLGADGTGADLLKIPAGGSAAPCTEERVRNREQYVQMNGNEVFKFAVRMIPKATQQGARGNGQHGRRPGVARSASGEQAHHRHHRGAARHRRRARLLQRREHRQHVGRLDTSGTGRPVY